MKKFLYPLIAVAVSSIAVSSITIAQPRRSHKVEFSLTPDMEFLTSASTTSIMVPFSEAVRVGNILYMKGNIGNIPGKKQLVEGGIKAETFPSNGKYQTSPPTE